MKSETYISAKILDDSVRVDITGPASEVMELFEAAAVDIFKELRDCGYPDTKGLFCHFVENVTKEVFPDDL